MNFLVVGSGLYGSVFSRQAAEAGHKITIIEKRHHIGGNVYSEKIEDIDCHMYGAHIFHTSDKECWDYVNKFAAFNRYTNEPIAKYHSEIYNLPFNMNTFSKLWGVTTPQEAKNKIDSQRLEITDPKNLEEQALSLVGQDIYNKLIKDYTEKQWGRSCKELPAFIIRRLPLRFTYDNNYFDDNYQGVPEEGYTKMIENILDHQNIEINLETDFYKDREEYEKLYDMIVYTGMIDEYFDYCYGQLEYRSLRFENEVLNMENFQGNAVVNYTDKNNEFTRIIEHKHFTFGKQKNTVITREYPKDWKVGDEPYYPINDSKNDDLFNKYKQLAERRKNMVFGGRLATYKYYNMDQVIRQALNDSQRVLKGEL